MTITAKELYELLPAIYRIRDAELGGPLKNLIAVLAEQAAAVEENIEQLYDDQFIETCADWAAPYIGGLVGYRPLHGVTAEVASPRAEVANTIAYRRRKGTAAVLEQLARDVTDWPARVVEFFRLTATAQYMNHVRPDHVIAVDMRNWEGLERVGTAFDPFACTVDVRSIARSEGSYNFPNIGLFLWRLAPFRLHDSPAIPLDARRFLISPLGHAMQLFTRSEAEQVITSLAEPVNVPAPISRRVLSERAGDYYGEGRSILVRVGGVPVPVEDISACNLADDGAGGWAHTHPEKIAIDPVLGRIAFPDDVTDEVQVTFHTVFSAAMGGGEYERAAVFLVETGELPRRTVPGDHPTIQAALDSLPPTGGIVEVVDNGRYDEAVTIQAGEGAVIELRAGNDFRPILLLQGDLTITGGEGARVSLDGLMLSRGEITVPDDGANALEALTLRHVTLVPGRELTAEGDPAAPEAVSLTVEIAGLDVMVDHTILGPLRLARGSRARINDSIVDAMDATGVAVAAPAAAEPSQEFAGELTIVASTVIGKIACHQMQLVSNSILHARLEEATSWPAPVHVVRKQEGCLRFSYVPQGSIVPRRYRCQPQLAIDLAIAAREQALGGPVPPAERAAIRARQARRLQPSFTSLRYGQPGYGQLRRRTPAEIRTGADDESEMGAFHALYQPQREANLRIRLEEYLRFGLEAGLFFET